MIAAFAAVAVKPMRWLAVLFAATSISDSRWRPAE